MVNFVEFGGEVSQMMIKMIHMIHKYRTGCLWQSCKGVDMW